MSIDSPGSLPTSHGRSRLVAASAVLVLIAVLLPLRAEEPLRVSNKEGRQAAIVKPEPDYPPMAKQLRVCGRAVIDAYVDVEGKVEKVEIVSGSPLFTAASSAVVKKWKFKPFKTADRKATIAIVELQFDFNL